MRNFIGSFWNSKSGATAVEYAMIAMFLSVASIVGVQAMSPKMQGLYASIATATKHP